MANLTKKQLLWNDFHILPGDVFDTKDTRFFEEKNMMAIGFSYNEENPAPLFDTTLYCYRVALRALGFRITKHFTQVNHHDFSLNQQVFITNMPKTVYDANPKIEDCESEEFICGGDSESDDDDDDSSVESEPTDENPSDSSNGK